MSLTVQGVSDEISWESQQPPSLVNCGTPWKSHIGKISPIIGVLL